MTLQILRRQPTQTLSQRPLCLRSVLLRIREREHRERQRRAYWRRFFGLEQIPAEDENEYTSSIALAEAIVAGGVILFCACLMLCVVALALGAYSKPEPKPRRYVVQSGFVEVVPK